MSSFLFIPVLLDIEFHSLKLEIPSSEGIPLYTLVSYFVIPIVLIFANYLAHRIDPYEILIKFWHVYLLLFFNIDKIKLCITQIKNIVEPIATAS